MKIGNFVLTFFCVASSLAAQPVIHVSPRGDDNSGNGTSKHPFASLQRAYDEALSYSLKDTLFIRMAEGVYPLKECLRITASPTMPVVVEGIRDVVLSGGIRLTNWKLTKHGWWTTHIADVEKGQLKVEQLYVNGSRATRARTPDDGEFPILDCRERMLVSGERGQVSTGAVQKLVLSSEQLKSLRGLEEEEIRDVVATFYHKWDNTFRYVSRAVPDSGVFYVEGPKMRYNNVINSSSRVVLENYKTAMTKPGEWFLNRTGDLYYIPRKGEKLKNLEAYAPVVETLLRIEGGMNEPVRNLFFRNLKFQHAAYVHPLQGELPEQAAALVPATIHLNDVENIHFENCGVHHTGIYGFWFERACHDCSVKHTEMTDLGAGGIKIGETVFPQPEQVTRGIVVEDNIIQHVGKLFPHAVGVVIFHSADNKVIHNEISDVGYSGVSVGWYWGYGNSQAVNNEIAYNHIHHLGWGKLSDMGGIYTLGTSPGTHIHHNVIHDVLSSNYGGWGIYTDEGSSYILIENNLVYGCTSGGFHQHYGKDNIVRNNIFALSRDWQLQFSRVEDHRSFTFSNNIVIGDCGEMVAGDWMKAHLDMHDNLYWNLRTENPTFLGLDFDTWRKSRDVNSLLMNPLFVNPLKGNFHFKNTENIDKIGFIPFEVSEAGVRGSKEWKKRALLSKETIEKFRKEVREHSESYSGYYR